MNVQAPRLVKEFYKKEPMSIERVTLDCNPTELGHSVKPLPPWIPGRSFPLYPKAGHHQHHQYQLRRQKLPRLSHGRSSDRGHIQHINTTSLFQDNTFTSPTLTPWNTHTSARKNTAISISKMSDTPFLQYPRPEQDNGRWDTDFAMGDSPIGAILDQNLPRTALLRRTPGLMLPDYENSDTAVEANISMPPTLALVEPKREPAAMPFLEEIFQDLPILEDGHPGHLWFQWTEAPGHPPFQIYDGPRLITLPYIRYQETNGDTYLVGTKGRDQPIHYRPIHLGPAAPVEGIQVDDNNVGFLMKDPTFNFALAQALKGLNDPGTLAEVSRFRSLTHQINVMQGCGYYLERLANKVREMQQELMQESAAFCDSILKCQERLVAGKVRARVIRTLQQQATQGLLGSRFYLMENGPVHRNIFNNANLL